MTNKEFYKRTFSALRAPQEFTEERKMKKTTIFKKLLPAAAAIVLVLIASTAAYTANVGGIQRKVQLWIRGDLTDATLNIENGNYTYTYTDENGQTQERGGGGVAFDWFGNERPLTEEEIIEHLNEPEADFTEDGRIMVYYHNQAIDITDKFEDGVCYVELKDGEKTIYATLKYDGDKNNGIAMATDFKKYPNPKTLN
ncbi:MAG: hypothetical protein IJR47_04925 [Clostridia bacterium]|nr:hypothetical protein [Clostridia bacterium]